MSFVNGTTKAHPTLPCGADPKQFAKTGHEIVMLTVPRIVQSTLGRMGETAEQAIRQDRHMCGRDGSMLIFTALNAAWIALMAELAGQARLALSGTQTGIGNETTREQMRTMLYTLQCAIEEVWVKAEALAPGAIAGDEAVKRKVAKETADIVDRYVAATLQTYGER